MPRQNNSNKDVMRYAGLGAQMLVSMGLAVFAGYHADKWLKLSFPLLIMVLPILVLAMLIYKLIKDTSKNNDSPK